MRHRTLAAVAVTVTVVVGSAVLGTAAVVSGSTSGRPMVTSHAAVRAASSPTGPAASDAAARAMAPAPVGSAAVVSDAPGPLDPQALDAGLSGAYRFVAHLDGLPGLMSLGGVVQGTVSDPQHFALEFPDSSFITRYRRDGALATAIVDGRAVSVTPGVGTLGDISPEDLLPGGLWAQAIAPWESALVPGAVPGTYTADSGVLVSCAKKLGILASGWQLKASTDSSGRLVSLAFSGAAWDQPFSLDLVVLYG